MTKEETYEYIERYLEEKLSQEELLLFKRKLNADENFEKKVNLHKQLQSQLSDKKKISLASNLANLNETFSKPSHVKHRRLRSILSIAAACLVILILFQFLDLLNQPNNDQKSPPVVQENNSQEESPLHEKIKPVESQQSSESGSPKDLVMPQELKQTPEENEELAFESNDYFERLINTMHSETYQFEFELAEPEAGFISSNKLNLSGSLQSLKAVSNESFTILIFNNRARADKEENALLKAPIILERDDDGEIYGFGSQAVYHFKFAPIKEFEEGLYYYTIIEKKTGDQITAGKVSIN